jgi:putative GTP pyrophosphokinase
MEDSEELNQFLEQYAQYVIDVLKPTEDEIKALFRSWTDTAYWGKSAQLSRLPSPSPIQFIRTRKKRPESVVDKILRKPSLFPDGLTLDSVRVMNDAVAARIVVYFLANLPLIHHEILNTEALEVCEERPPVAYLREDLTQRLGLAGIRRVTKDSGYASIHYTLRFRQSKVPKEQRPWFELQVRTVTEHVWGEIEHILGYKPNKRTSFAVRKQFQIISSELTAIDEHFNLLFEELSRYQQEVTYRENDPLNAENLPAVLSDIGIGCAQKEIDGLLKLLNSRGIESVGALTDIASPELIDIIRNIYRAYDRRTPDNFEIVASLAAAHGITEEAKIIAAIKTQIDFLKAWEELKKRTSAGPDDAS